MLNSLFTHKSPPSNSCLKFPHSWWVSSLIRKFPTKFWGLSKYGRNFSSLMTIYFLCSSSSMHKSWKNSFQFLEIMSHLTDPQTSRFNKERKLRKKERNSHDRGQPSKELSQQRVNSKLSKKSVQKSFWQMYLIEKLRK